MGRGNSLKILTRKSFVLYLAALLIFWNEIVYIFLYSLFWNVLQDESVTGGRSTRILIVADPQLIGYQNEPPLIGPLARWDADRYLHNGFYYALLHGQPDLIVYLGDLFDEGVQASDEEFEWTMVRFNSIFNSWTSIQRVFITGDNDIGGEGEPVLTTHVERFRRRFPNTLHMAGLGLDGVAVDEMNVFNGVTRNLTDPNAPTTKKKKKKDELLIMLSHAPIIRSYGIAAKKAVDANADLILSAHDHTAEVYIRRRTASSVSSFDRIPLERHSSSVSALIGRTEPTVEMQTPTCSYRMGVPVMGYGLLTLKTRMARGREEGEERLQMEAKYAVLWLPGRYPQLLSYGVLLLWLIILMAHRCLYTLLRSIILRRRPTKQNIV